MAFTQFYDQYAPILGGVETEEERRKRLEEEAAAATPVTQTIKTNPVTGEQEMTIKGTPEALSADNPLTPTVTGPAVPDQSAAETQRLAAQNAVAAPVVPQGIQVASIPGPVSDVGVSPEFQRMRQIESGGRDFNEQGQPLTSPKGAMFANQVMPSTAANPGFGVRPAAAQTPEEYNRVGEDYFAAMQKRYPGQPELARAAYNAGPGAVDRAVQVASAQGGNPLDYLPKETQAYVQKTGAQAPQLVTPVAPGQAPAAAPAAAAPAMTPEQVQRETQMRDFQEASKNPDAMIQYMARKDVPEDLKTAMKLNHYETLLADDRKAKAEQKVISTITNSPQNLPKIINDKSEEGSLAKAFLYSLIGFKSGADAEVAKMNLPGDWKPVMDADGNTGMVLFSTNGKPLQGVKADGSKMAANEITAYASQGLSKTTDISLTQHQAIVDGELHTFSSKRTPSGIMYKDDSVPDSKWTRQAPAGLTTLGKVDRIDIMASQAGKQVMDKMRAENVKAISQKVAPPHSEDAILKAGAAAREAVLGGKTPVGQAPAPAAVAPAATIAQPAAPAAPTAVRPVAPTATAPAAPAAQPVARPVRPGNVSPEIEAEAQAIYSGQKAPITGMGAQNYRGRAVMDRVNEIATQTGEPFDASKFKIVQKTRQDFITGQQGKAVQSMNVAVDHLDTLQQAANALKNGDVPLFNKFANAYGKATGEAAPNNFNAVKSIVGSEVAKAVAGGATALGDREEIRKEINDAGSPEQLAGVIDKYQRLMAGQVKGLKQTYESGTGMKDFDNKLLPRTKEVLNRIHAEETGAPASPAEKAKAELEKRRKGQQ